MFETGFNDSRLIGIHIGTEQLFQGHSNLKSIIVIFIIVRIYIIYLKMMSLYVLIKLRTCVKCA